MGTFIVQVKRLSTDKGEAGILNVFLLEYLHRRYAGILAMPTAQEGIRELSVVEISS